jgi:hypothetical protein
MAPLSQATASRDVVSAVPKAKRHSTLIATSDKPSTTSYKRAATSDDFAATTDRQAAPSDDPVAAPEKPMAKTDDSAGDLDHQAATKAASAASPSDNPYP